jgi:hypothetical protein
MKDKKVMLVKERNNRKTERDNGDNNNNEGNNFGGGCSPNLKIVKTMIVDGQWYVLIVGNGYVILRIARGSNLGRQRY